MFTLVGSTTFAASEWRVRGVASDGTHLYVLTANSVYANVKLTKVRIEGMVRGDSIPFPGEWGTDVTTDGTHCYVLVGPGTITRVAKIRTSDMVEVGSLTLNTSEDGIGIINSGDYCLVLTGGGRPGVFAQLIRIRTADMVRMSSLPVASGAIAITDDGLFCYILAIGNPPRVLKHNLATMASVGVGLLDPNESPGVSVAVDDTYCYVLADFWGDRLARIRKADMIRTGGILIPASEPWWIMFGKGITGAGDHCYFIGHEIGVS